MDEGNPRLREMGWGRARELCQREMIHDPEALAKYKQWVEVNKEQIRSMGEDYRAVGTGGRIPSKQIH